MAPMDDPLVLITGSSGFLGQAIARGLRERYRIIGFDVHAPKKPLQGMETTEIDLGSEESVAQALAEVRRRAGERIASVIHLAAYFDLTGEDNPKYDEITVRGTERLLRALKGFAVEQFVFASTMLVHAAGRPGDVIDESRRLDPKLPYPASKIATERLVHEQRDDIPVVYLRPAGVYDDLCRNPFLAHQIARIYERDPQGHVYPGDLATGQSYLHVEDLVAAIRRLVERRRELPPEVPLLLGEPDAMGYGDLQREIARHALGEENWQTWEIPKALAKTGAWAERDVLGEEPFIRPWMIDIADDHYAVDISRARSLLGWEPEHSLRASLAPMIAALKATPRAGTGPTGSTLPESLAESLAGWLDGKRHQRTAPTIASRITARRWSATTPRWRPCIGACGGRISSSSRSASGSSPARSSSRCSIRPARSRCVTSPPSGTCGTRICATRSPAGATW